MGANILPTVFVLIVSWWIHSTLLLGGVAAFSARRRDLSPGTSEWLWKTAVVLPLMTAPLQRSWQSSFIIWRWELAAPVVDETLPIVEKPAPSTRFPKPPSDPPNIIPNESADWQIEIIPAEAPAIAEKPISSSVPIASLQNPFVPVAGSEFPPAESITDPFTVEQTSSVVTPVERKNSREPSTETSDERIAFSSATTERNIPHRAWSWFVPTVVGVVLLSALLGGCRFLWLLLSTQRIIRRSRDLSRGPASCELNRLLKACKKRLPIRLAESAEIRIPAAGGLFRRVILLPVNAEREFPRDELKALLAHELGHHVRGDVRWLWFGRAVCHLLPIQPFHFLAVRHWHRAAEPLCDDWAVRQNISPLTLAKSLTRAAQWNLADSAIGPAATGGWSQLTNRVERLLHGQPNLAPDLRRRSVIGLMVLFASILMICSPQILLPSEAKDSKTLATHPGISENDEPLVSKIASPRGDSENRDSANGIPRDIWNELQTTQADLEQALNLVEAGEQDPEVRQLIDRLRHRLDSLHAKSERILGADTH